MSLNTELLKYGLSQKESDVYIALMELGSATVQQIAQKSGVNRATTYLILDGLRDKGLVSIYEKERRTYYAAESPQSLENLLMSQERELKQKREELKGIMPDLMGVFNLASNKPVVKYYEGENASKSMREEFWSTKGDEFRALMSYNDLKKILKLSEEEKASFIKHQGFLKERKEAGLTVKFIININEKDYQSIDDSVRKGFPLFEDYKFNVLQGYEAKGEMSFYGDKALIVRGRNHSTSSVIGVIISDKNLVNQYTILFDLAWSNLNN